MTEKLSPGGLPTTRKRYTPAFFAKYGRLAAAVARQTDVAHAQSISPALMGRWQRPALEQAVPSSAERKEIKRLQVALKRAVMKRNSRDHLFPTAFFINRNQFIQACTEPWPLQLRCQSLAVSPAGYYQRPVRPLAP